MSRETYTVIMEDAPVHTQAHPFYDDPDCFCHEDAGEIAVVQGYVADGLMTRNEATDYIAGRIPQNG